MAYDVIFATDSHNGIGKDNDLPWSSPTDLAHFKKITEGKHLVCSSKTYYGLPKVVQERVAVIQSSRKLDIEGKEVIGNITPELLDIFEEDLIVIGGSSMFTTRIITNARIIHHTLIHGDFSCDTRVGASTICRLRQLPYVIEIDNPASLVRNEPAITVRKYYAKLSGTNTNRSADGIA